MSMFRNPRRMFREWTGLPPVITGLFLALGSTAWGADPALPARLTPPRTEAWRGVHLMAPSASQLPLLKRAITEALVPLGINTLVLEVDYSFDWQSHPELRSPGAISRSEARELAALCRKHALRLIPLFNCLGHQSWAKNTSPLLMQHPDLDETPDLPKDNPGIYCRSWCPQHPQVNRIVFALMDELIEAFEAEALHVGMDEVFLIASEHCPRCRGQDPAQLFARAVNDYHRHLAGEKKVTMLMWGDRLLDDATMKYGKWESSANGTAPAIHLIPKDIILCDWHYELRPSYPSVPYFQAQGFRVWPSSWRNQKAALALLQFARQVATEKMIGHLCTTWSSSDSIARLLLGQTDPESAKVKDIVEALQACMAALAPPAHWPQFRGPNGSGLAPNSNPPVHFAPATNVLWKTALPAGHSSPCIWGDRIFLTGLQDGKLETLCLDRRDGQIQWRRAAPVETLESVSWMGSPANPTPATDGTQVYVYFGSYGLLCYDLAGQERWKKPLPTPVTQHGAGTSPIVASDRVLLNCDQDVGSYLLALNRLTGETAWKIERPGFRRGFSTPILWRCDSEELVIVPGTLRVAAYHLIDGAERWTVHGLPNEMCPSPVLGDGLLFVGAWTTGAAGATFPPFSALLDAADKNQDGKLSRDEAPPGAAQQHFLYMDANKDGQLTRAEYDSIAAIFARSENALLAIRPGGSGEVTSTHVVWKQTRGLPYVPSPLFYQHRVYVVKNGGIASCFNATNGAALYREERLGALGDYYSSPVAARDRIYVASQPGVVVVFAAGDTLNVLARNNLEEPIMATPAIVENRLYVRTKGHLYAFGE